MLPELESLDISQNEIVHIDHIPFSSLKNHHKLVCKNWKNFTFCCLINFNF